MKIYLSSTFVDLKHHRARVGRALRKADYEVVMMEEYVARDELVEFACQGDVAACDVYVGVFAWRYGHIPEEANPEQLSVTEMEYAAASAKPMTRLTFLLKDGARWPKARRDADATRIQGLRDRLKKRCSAYFATKDELATEVLAALRVEESTRLAERLDAIDAVLQAQELGPSFMMNIKDKLGLLAKEQFVELKTGPTEWWNTRLHLVAALAEDLGRTRGLAFLDDEGRFLLMASPKEIRHRLALRWPALEEVYTTFRREARTTEEVEEQLWRYPTIVGETLGDHEQAWKVALSAHDLSYELGVQRNAEVVDVKGKGQRLLQGEILGRQTPFAARVREGRLEGLVDRDLLGRRVAQAVLV